ncbi:BQ5605_C005g03378 [Microbotryum silenes-dioicae]|uniref:BQ5605_C005g03378 protein n=1 Tax=Microbotryum silenes-dioicae TaxID=796604 RepID=A0A2X0PCD8_9BASI|nr:BQ5605_C005g03378 [Microbotryum silenes-dioicae]
MPTHHGYLEEFPWIRVDAFDGLAEVHNPYNQEKAYVHLLTHAHTDHTTGLNSPDFGSTVYCTSATKEILRHTMEAGDRVRSEEIKQISKRYKYADLRKPLQRNTDKMRIDTLFKLIEYNVPLTISGPAGESVTVTAIDANHCPGSAMFLIEGTDGVSVLITGDIRAENWWIESLARNRYLSPYLAWSDLPYSTSIDDDLNSTRRALASGSSRRLLKRTYLDTSTMSWHRTVASKEEAIRDLVRLIRYYPEDTSFFINAWTWGYEELLKGLSRAFDEKIHLDPYKATIYRAISATDPQLSQLGTTSTRPLRFHACERRWKCDQVWDQGQGCYEWLPEYLPCLEGPKRLKRPGVDRGKARVVYVNPTEGQDINTWKKYVENTEALLKRMEAKENAEVNPSKGKEENWPTNLFVSLSRHSTLPELQKFVRLFRPLSLYPLVMDDPRNDPGYTYRLAAHYFAPFVSPSQGFERILRDAETYSRHFVETQIRAGHRIQLVQRTQTLLERGVQGIAVAVGSGPITDLDEDYFINSEKMQGVRSNIEGGEELLRQVEQWAGVDGPASTASSSDQSDPDERRAAAQVKDEEVKSALSTSRKAISQAEVKHEKLKEVETIIIEDSQDEPSSSTGTILVPATLEPIFPSLSTKGEQPEGVSSSAQFGPLSSSLPPPPSAVLDPQLLSSFSSSASTPIPPHSKLLPSSPPKRRPLGPSNSIDDHKIKSAPVIFKSQGIAEVDSLKRKSSFARKEEVIVERVKALREAKRRASLGGA